MENKDTKQFYLFVKGEKVAVSEEVYRAYVRPVSAAQKAEMRTNKCLIKGKCGHLVRCKEDCRKCKYYEDGNILPGGVISLDSLVEGGYEYEAGVDMEGDVIDKEESADKQQALHLAMQKLNDRQRYIIREIYFNGKSQAELCRIFNMEKSAMSKTVSRALKSLRKFLGKF